MQAGELNAPIRHIANCIGERIAISYVRLMTDRNRASVAVSQLLGDFEAVAQTVWDNLPSEFREIVGNLSIQIEDFAGRETLDHMRIHSRYDLLGLYHGVGLPFKSVSALPYGPDMIFLYRVPILAFARDEGLSVPDVIKHVLIHEIGHHFGFSDEDMDAIEAGEA